MPEVTLSVQPVGVKFYTGDHNAPAGVPLYEGISYCDAVRRATTGEELVVRAESITSCRWSPVVLGLKEAESGFEKRQEPRLEGTHAVLLAPLTAFEARGLESDVVILRDEPGTLRYLSRIVGPNRCAREYADELDKSALGHLWENRSDWKVKLTMGVNRLLAILQKQEWFRKLIAAIFRSEVISDLFDRIISRSMADMSICRNSSVLPRKTGMANISFFCTGGIAWGMNRTQHMTSGWPWPVFNELSEKVTLKW
ncbi:MAG: hypothetical protein AB1384_08820 [Actinomycetota bacterium]